MLAYTSRLLHPVRRLTHEVRVGDVTLGGKYPIAVQSMTTAPTLDTAAMIAQIQRLVDVGCDIIRITTPTMAELENVVTIRAEMKRLNLKVPLVADVHFLPKIALRACEIFEKVRINPGNFADRKRFDVREYTDAQYQEELDRIREAFLPLIAQAKKNGTALRIGTNHGSLSDRIMNRFGDTPLGMVESALEFLRIAEDENFRNIVISMKASNPRVMIQAYRLLVSRLNELGWPYPLHLGVTEAGNGEDGRVKSAAGIGSLLSDGLGDTVRVSLTEDPEYEIPVAKALVSLYQRPFEDDAQSSEARLIPSWDFYTYDRRVSQVSQEPIKVSVPVAYATLARGELELEKLDPLPERLVCTLSQAQDLSLRLMDTSWASQLALRVPQNQWADLRGLKDTFSEWIVKVHATWLEGDYFAKLESALQGRTLTLEVQSLDDVAIAMQCYERSTSKASLNFQVSGSEIVAVGRQLAAQCAQNKLRAPIYLRVTPRVGESQEKLILRAASELGALLCDGIGDGVELDHPDPNFAHQVVTGILQATRLRMSRADYIACPSCGRTLFDLQETTARIKERTQHLKGVKIAIMGCIVNGPGEMADADFGYVGSGPGHINLYVGKECVERHIPQEKADEALIALIKSHGRWVEPPVVEA